MVKSSKIHVAIVHLSVLGARQKQDALIVTKKQKEKTVIVPFFIRRLNTDGGQIRCFPVNRLKTSFQSRALRWLRTQDYDCLCFETNAVCQSESPEKSGN